MQAAKEEGFEACLSGDQGESTFDAPDLLRRLDSLPGTGGEVSTPEAMSHAFAHTAFIDYDDQQKLLVHTQFPKSYEESMGDYIDYYTSRVSTNDHLAFALTMAYCRTPARNLSRHVQSGAIGVECRSGFGDADLWRFMRSVPHRYRGAGEHRNTRYLLNQAYGHLLPSLKERENKGGLPGIPWIFPGYEEVQNAMLTIIRRLPETGLFNARYIDRLIEKFQQRETKTPTMMKIHSLFDLACWFDYYVYKRDPFRGLI
jgi:hypothetical protein